MQLQRLIQTKRILNLKYDLSIDSVNGKVEEGNILIPIATSIKPLLIQLNKPLFNENEEKFIIDFPELILTHLINHFNQMIFSREDLLDEMSLMSTDETKEKILKCFKKRYVKYLMDIKNKLDQVKTIVYNVLFNYKRDIAWKRGLITLLKEVNSDSYLEFTMKRKWENEDQKEEKMFQEFTKIIKQIDLKQSSSTDRLKDMMNDVKVKMDCLIK